MNTLKLLFVLSCLLFTACSTGDRIPCDESNGNVITQELATPLFHSVSNQSTAHVHITQTDNNEYSVKTVGSSNLLEKTRISVRDGRLEIISPTCFSNRHAFEVHIRMPRILALELTRSGKIIGANSWYTDAVGIKNTGSGEIDIELDATHLDITQKGSGKIKLYGVAPTMYISQDASGKIEAFGLYCKQVDAIVAGSGDTEIAVSENLKAQIKGSGDIRYKGYPTLEVVDEGSGDVENWN